MQNMLKSKKGQFYILIALLLVSYAFGLARRDVPVSDSKDTFQLLNDGYISEGANVINNAVFADADVDARFSNFTDDYLAFAKSADPAFRLVYLLRHDGELAIGNRLDGTINVTFGDASYEVQQGSRLVLPASDVALRVSGASYDFRFSEDDIQLKALFRSSGKLSTRVVARG